jgi:hypothetical protein
MRLISALALALLSSTQALSAPFDYRCVYGGGEGAIDVRIDGQTLTIFNLIEGNGSSRKGNLVFVNRGLRGGNSRMSDRFLYVWSKELSTIHNWTEVDRLFVQTSLPSGGELLSNGGRGGSVSFVGESLGYESYVCFLRG